MVMAGMKVFDDWSARGKMIIFQYSRVLDEKKWFDLALIGKKNSWILSGAFFGTHCKFHQRPIMQKYNWKYL